MFVLIPCKFSRFCKVKADPSSIKFHCAAGVHASKRMSLASECPVPQEAIEEAEGDAKKLRLMLDRALSLLPLLDVK